MRAPKISLEAAKENTKSFDFTPSPEPLGDVEKGYIFFQGDSINYDEFTYVPDYSKLEEKAYAKGHFYIGKTSRTESSAKENIDLLAYEKKIIPEMPCQVKIFDNISFDHTARSVFDGETISIFSLKQNHVTRYFFADTEYHKDDFITIMDNYKALKEIKITLLYSDLDEVLKLKHLKP